MNLACCFPEVYGSLTVLGFTQASCSQIRSLPTPAKSEQAKWGAHKWGRVEAGKATWRHRSRFTSSFAVKTSMNFMLISKILKNVVLNYSCSLGLFLLLLGIVFLNCNYKSLKRGAPGREEAASVTRRVERTRGSTKGTEINLEPFPATQQFYTDVRGVLMSQCGEAVFGEGLSCPSRARLSLIPLPCGHTCSLLGGQEQSQSWAWHMPGFESISATGPLFSALRIFVWR